MEKRKAFRMSVDTNSDISVQISDPVTQPIEVTLLNITEQGVGVEVPTAKSPDFTVGNHVVIEISSLSRKLSVSADGQIIHQRTPTNGSIQYGIKFTNPAQLAEECADTLKLVLNRRSQVRVRPDQDAPIYARIKDGDEWVKARVIDISAGGVCLVAALEMSPNLIDRQSTIKIRLAHPEQEHFTEFTGIARRCQLVNNKMLFGIEFLRDEKQQTQRAAFDKITRYIMQRQRETSRTRIQR